MLLMMKFIFTMVPMLLSVAFITLLERKVLGLSQSRKGPNKISMTGFFQPFADVEKLFIKENNTPKNSNKIMFLMSPSLHVTVILCLWSIIPVWSKSEKHCYWVMGLLLFMSMNLYPLIISGWSSHASYAFIGAVRGVAQTISYEISLAILILSLVVLHMSLSVKDFFIYSGLACLFITPLIVLITVSALAETNRAPFDFSEGESELVSGFNIEYGGGGFSLIFMAEYSAIIFFSMIISMLLFPFKSYASLGLLTISVSVIWIWIRSTFPRYRYDKLMNMAWKSILPLSLGLLIFYMSV